MIAEIVSNSGTLEFRSLAGASAGGLPVGSILALHTNRVPAGYLPCNGATYDITQYPALYTILQTNVLPDLREMNLVGAGANATQDITTHDTYTIGQFKDDQVQEVITGAESETSVSGCVEPHCHCMHCHSDTANFGTGSCGSVIKSNVNTTMVFTSGAYINCEGDTIAADPKIYATATTTTTITCNVNSRTGSTTHGKNYGVFFVIKAVTGITEIDDAEVYAQVVNLLESNYIQKSTFTNRGIPYYNCDTGCFSSIDYPASSVNHNVVLTAINGGSCTCTTSAYNLNGTTDYVYGDLTAVPSCISSNWEVTQYDHVAANVVKHNDSYYICDSSCWYPITSINYPSVYCGSAVADSDLIDILDTCTQNYMDWGSYTYSITCWDYGWCDAASAVSNLTDVCLSNLCDGQYLQYDATNCTWNNVELSTAVSNLTDVCLNNIYNCQILQYDSTTCTWNNKTFEVSSVADVCLSNLADGDVLQYNANTCTWDNVAGAVTPAYIRNQNVLSTPELIGTGTCVDACTMCYDGFVYIFRNSGSGWTGTLTRGGVDMCINQYSCCGGNFSLALPVYKCDILCVKGNCTSGSVYASYYKLRDYTDR